MKKILFFLILTLNLKAQNCLVAYDDIEAYDWTGAGWAVGFPTTGFYNNASVSPTLSAVLYGTGTGTSVIENGFYILPSPAPISAAYDHRLSFRLASYRFTAPTSAAAGVDGPDYIEVQVSTNGGPYVSELRITGNGNAYWTYASTASTSKTISGTLTTVAPAAGGDRTTTGDGYSFISVTIPAGPTTVAFRLFARVNAAGEEWWIDDIELNQLAPCIVLPIELLSFEGQNKEEYNSLTWVTASETNNDYFLIERSHDGLNWFILDKIKGGGTTSSKSFYSYNDLEYNRSLTNYYRLSQTDFDGKREYFDLISVKSNTKKESGVCNNYYYYDLLGNEINIKDVPVGLYLRKCGDYIEKIIKTQ